MKPPREILRAGDCLLYRPASPIGWVIAVKTWTWISHTEVFAGGGCAYASRHQGVGLYLYDDVGVGFVLRPKQDAIFGKFYVERARQWFKKVNGQKYDFLGLLCFTLAVRQGAKDRMFCSELATRLYRNAGFQPFSESVDADHVAPAQFLQSPAFEVIWRDDGLPVQPAGTATSGPRRTVIR